MKDCFIFAVINVLSGPVFLEQFNVELVELYPGPQQFLAMLGIAGMYKGVISGCQ